MYALITWATTYSKNFFGCNNKSDSFNRSLEFNDRVVVRMGWTGASAPAEI